MKPLDHIRITAEAVRQFVRLSHGPVAPMLLQNSRLVQKGAEDADISPIFTRATNWHFYNRNLDLNVLHESVWPFMEPLTIHLSSDHILKRRYEQLKDETSKGSLKDSCDLTGRILHHIQDMSSPSHVVPVFHGPLVPDSFETYLHDIYLADESRLRDFSSILATNRGPLAPQPGTTVLQLYQEAAESTLTLLKPGNSSCKARVNGQLIELPWSYFWADKDTYHQGDFPSECKFGGFGKFGPLGKHFGITKGIRSGNDVYHIEQQVYNDFCNQLVKEMLINSVKTLLLIEPELAKLC